MAAILKTISSQVAQARAAEFLHENELIRFNVGVPRRLVSALRSVWSVPVELRYPSYGLVGEVGVIAIDEEVGSVVAWTPRQEMLTNAGDLHYEYQAEIRRTRMIEPAQDPRHPLIYQREGAGGYEPAIVGTGVRVRNIVGYERIYNGDLSEITSALPHISLEQVQAALAYYQDHQAEIEFFIAENDSDYNQAIMQVWEQHRPPKSQ